MLKELSSNLCDFFGRADELVDPVLQGLFDELSEGVAQDAKC
jgi:hypothetical protein